MPIIAVIILTQTGLQVISDTLAQVDPETKVIQIFNPSDGTLFTEITAEITWPATGVITLEFAKSSIYQAFHTGLDIANPEGKVGDPIYSFMEEIGRAHV
jgi:murein DD-endopeptidase MepM/ murein hydrolase activator NlpD